MQMPALVGAFAEDFCQPGQTPQFAGGFADLQAQLGDTMGTPLDCEHVDPNTGDSQMTTSTGLAFYRKQTNTPTFTDGYNHYALTGDGLVSWTGASIDPPGVCVEPYDRPDRACLLKTPADLLGYLRTSGSRNVYSFATSDPATVIDASLVDLPADYDLYLVDGNNQVLAGSVLDGTDPRQLNLTLPDAGAYYLYVVSDPGRTADPNDPYHFLFAQVPPPIALPGAETAEGQPPVTALAPPPPSPDQVALVIPADKAPFIPPPLVSPPTETPTPTATARPAGGGGGATAVPCVTITPTPVTTPQPVGALATNPNECVTLTPTSTATLLATATLPPTSTPEPTSTSVPSHPNNGGGGGGATSAVRVTGPDVRPLNELLSPADFADADASNTRVVMAD
jgi:hypothetical protein